MRVAEWCKGRHNVVRLFTCKVKLLSHLPNTDIVGKGQKVRRHDDEHQIAYVRRQVDRLGGDKMAYIASDLQATSEHHKPHESTPVLDGLDRDDNRDQEE